MDNSNRHDILNTMMSLMTKPMIYTLILLLNYTIIFSLNTHTIPELSKVIEAEPIGHLKALGKHQKPEGNIDVLDRMPSPEELFKNYIIKSKAVLLKNACKEFGATRKWNDNYLREQFGHVTVAVDIVKKEDRFESSRKLNLFEFLNIYNKTEDYLIDTLPTEMWKDFSLPDCLLCGGIADRLQDIVLWFNSGGSQSHLHIDSVDNLNCVVSGSKKWFLVDKEHSKDIILDHKEGDYCSVNVNEVDMFRYPFLQTLQWWNTTVETGDCLYVPHSWAHQVSSTSRNIAVNIWWTPMNHFNHTDCIYKKNRDSNLEKFSFSPAEQYRYQLFQLLQIFDGILNFKQIHENIMSEHTGGLIISTEDFKLLDKNGDDIIDESELINVTRKELVDIFDGEEPGTVNIFGKSMMDYKSTEEGYTPTEANNEKDEL